MIALILFIPLTSIHMHANAAIGNATVACQIVVNAMNLSHVKMDVSQYDLLAE